MATQHRRRFLELVAATGAVAVAGCSNSDSTGDDGGDTDETDSGEDDTTDSGGDDDGGEPELTISGPADGTVASNAIAKLAVVRLESQASEVFSVTVTLQNTGDQRTSAMNYTYTLALFDSNGTELGTVVANKANLGAGMAAGQQGSVIATPQGYDGRPGDVARYELTVDCSDEEGEDRGVYCS